MLIPQFATTDTDTKARIVQRGAVPPLIHMLSHTDVSLREMAAFALGRLAQNHDNQVRLQGRGAEMQHAWEGQCAGLVPLIRGGREMQHAWEGQCAGLVDQQPAFVRVERQRNA